jgi:hypothetical protein
MGFSFRSTGCGKADQRMLERKPHHQRVTAHGKDERKTRRVETVGLVKPRVTFSDFAVLSNNK